MDGCAWINGWKKQLCNWWCSRGNGLCPEIKQFIRYQEIHRFSMLVTKFIIYDEDSRARSTHCKSSNKKIFTSQNRDKPYINPSTKGSQKATTEDEIVGQVLFSSEVWKVWKGRSSCLWVQEYNFNMFQLWGVGSHQQLLPKAEERTRCRSSRSGPWQSLFSWWC